MPICPDGHTSGAADYCDVCGAPIETSSATSSATSFAPSVPPPATGVKPCPACDAPVSGRFCEACGHDSALPAPPATQHAADVQASVGWIAVVSADRGFYERVLARGGPDTVEFPLYFPERRIPLLGSSTLIGRHNRDHGVEPGIDLGIDPVDRGVSTQHAVLRLRDSSLTVTDLGSTNGTTLNGGDDLLSKNEEIPLTDGDRVHVGAWTTITIERVR